MPFNFTKEKKGVNRMHQKTKRKIGKFVCAVLAMAFLVSLPYAQVSAAQSVEVVSQEVQVLEAVVYELPSDENRPALRTIFYNGIVNVNGSDDGMLIEVSAEANGVASEIGIKDIKIQRKVWYGWSTVATSSGGVMNNVSSVGCRILYPDAVKGATYRILYTVFGNVDGYAESDGSSGEFVYSY